MKQKLQRYLSVILILAISGFCIQQTAIAQGDKIKKNKEVQMYVCDICGNTFHLSQLDTHFAETAKQAAEIRGITWSGKLVTFNTDGKAWCPNCFKDAMSMRGGTRTVHLGEKRSYLPVPDVDIDYQCECGKNRTFKSRSVNIYTGAEVICSECGAILCVSPAIFDHSKPSRAGEASLRTDYKDKMIFVKFRKSELVQQLKKGLITEQEFTKELKRRGL